jgi:hypothetical protein
VTSSNDRRRPLKSPVGSFSACARTCALRPLLPRLPGRSVRTEKSDAPGGDISSRLVDHLVGELLETAADIKPMAFASLRLIFSSHFFGRNERRLSGAEPVEGSSHPGSASVADTGTIRASRRARIACPARTRITWATGTCVSRAAGAIICWATRTIVFPPTWPRILWSAGPVVRTAAWPSVAGTSGTSVGCAARTLIRRASGTRVAGTAGAGVTLAIASIPSDGQAAEGQQEDCYQYEPFFHETLIFQSWATIKVARGLIFPKSKSLA